MTREFIVLWIQRIPIMKNFSFRICLSLLFSFILVSFAFAETQIVRSFKFIKMQPITAEGRAPVVTGLSLSGDGTKLVTVGDDHKARVWNVSDGRLIHTLGDQKDWIRSVKFSPDGKMFVTGGMDDQLYCYDAATNQRLMQFESADTSIRAIAFDPSDSARMAVVGFDASVYIYDTAVGRKMRAWGTTCSDQRAVSFSTDSRYVAAAGRDGNVRLFDMATGRTVTDLRHHSRRVWALGFSEDKKYLATGGEDRKICLWDMKTFQLLKVLEFPSGKVSAITFCGSGMIAAGSTNNRICVWNLHAPSSDPAFVMNEHQGTIAELLWDSESKTLISGSFDATVRFWKLQTSDMAVSEVPAIR